MKRHPTNISLIFWSIDVQLIKRRIQAMLSQFDGQNPTGKERTRQPIELFLGVKPLNGGSALLAVLLAAAFTVILLFSVNASTRDYFLAHRGGQMVSGVLYSGSILPSSSANVPVYSFSSPSCWPDLSDSVKSADKREVAEKDILTYTIVLVNTDENGTVFVSDVIPTFTSHTAGSAQVTPPVGVITDTASHIEWKGIVPSNSAITIAFPVTVSPGASDGETIRNTAWISYGDSLISRTVDVTVNVDFPNLWGCTPSRWVTLTQTPTCTVQARDLTSGLDVKSAFHKYSTDGGASWNDVWLPADCSGVNSTTISQTITAPSVPFQQDSKTMNLIKFMVSDMTGHTAHHTCTIPIDITPPTLGNFHPQGFVTTTRTPTCTTVVSDVTSGLDVGSAFYKYSTDGGASWNGVWLPADRSGMNGTVLSQTITAPSVPFQQDSETTNLIKFMVGDTVGHTAQHIYTVPIDTTPPTFGDFHPREVVTTTRAPTCTIVVSDVTSGLDVNSAFYKYSTDGGGYWSDWITATCTGLTGTVEPQLVTATGVPFEQNGSTRNLIQFRISDVAGHSASSVVHSVSISVPYTFYLPLIAKNYTHPLLNGDFEVIADDFAAYWERGGALSVTITTTLYNGEGCYSNDYCVLLGSPNYPCNNVPLGYGQVSQTFGVPRTGTPRLSFYYRIFSFDELDNGIYDSFDVYIDNVLDGAPPILILRDGSTDEKHDDDCDGSDLDDTGWRNSPEFDLSAISDGSGGTVDYRGKTVQLSFYVYSRELPPRTVGWFNTWVYLDNVQVK
jgi:hypothetical protein